jgi:predicted DNA-binding transcriptional regulator YafY
MLKLLSLLQSRQTWTGSALAERLEVSTRTVRNDVERLRSLGYDVLASPGMPGGYRLGAGGTSMPPLLLDPEEAVAVAVGLRTGVNCIIGGMEETSVRALSKLETLLPPRVRQRVRNLNRYTVPLPGSQPVPIVDPELLTMLAGMCDLKERVRFWYDSSPARTGAESAHDVEPYRLVNRDHRWYLLGYDVRAEDWRIFDVNRLKARIPPGPRFTARELTEKEVAALLAHLVPPTSWRCEALVTFHVPAAEAAANLLPIEGRVEPVDERTCRARVGGESSRAIALVLARVGLPFRVEHPPELVDEIRRVGERFRQAASA